MVMGLVGGGTWAYFSDVETSSGNTLTGGILDLNINGGDADVAILTTGITNVAPGDSGKEYITLSNAGTLAGELDISVTAYTENDNGTEEPENDQSTDTTTGDLGAVATMILWIDSDEDGSFGAGDIELTSTAAVAYDESSNPTLDQEVLDNFASSSWNDAYAQLDEAGGTDPSVRFYFEWTVPTSTDNRIMGDSADFDIQIELEQADND